MTETSKKIKNKSWQQHDDINHVIFSYYEISLLALLESEDCLVQTYKQLK